MLAGAYLIYMKYFVKLKYIEIHSYFAVAIAQIDKLNVDGKD